MDIPIYKRLREIYALGMMECGDDDSCSVSITLEELREAWEKIAWLEDDD